MDKPLKILLFALLGIIIIHFIFSIFTGGSLRAIRKDLERANRTADSALIELKFAKKNVDSIKSDIIVFRAYIARIQEDVETADLTAKYRNEKDEVKRAELYARLQRLKNVHKDSLPPIYERAPKE